MKIRIKNLRLRTIVGANEWEARKKQDVVINLEFEFVEDEAVATDSLEKSVNYKAIKRQIIDLVEKGRFQLLETLAHRVMRILAAHPRIVSATVEVDKPHALRFADSVSAVCTWEREE